MSGKWKCQGGHQLARKREVSVEAGVDDGLDGLHFMVGTGDLEFDHRFTVSYSAVDHGFSAAMCPPSV